MLNIGSKLGPYEILGVIGIGGMGEIYRARDARLGRDVAIKVLPDPLASNTEALARFEREARSLASLSHPNILTIHDFGHDQGIRYAVMELLEGENLRSRLKTGSISLEEFLHIITCISSALSAAHSRGVIHRDLKPENIFLTRDGNIKILDFGLATEAITATDRMRRNVKRDTEPGLIVGSIEYMSPEQIRGESGDSRSDIFSLGSLMFEMMSGRTPFLRTTPVDTLSAVLHDEPARPANGARTFPPEIHNIVTRCLKKDPGDRFQSSSEIRFALANLATKTTGEYLAARFNRANAYRIAALMLILVLIGALLFRLVQPSESSAHKIAVLPFTMLGSNRDADFISDGIAENMIRDLSEISGIQVMASSTVFRYKNSNLDPQTIGNQLHVETIVTGRILFRDDRLTIKAELVNVKNGTLLWAGEYRRNVSDILGMQDEIAKDVTSGLRLKLNVQQEQRLARHATENVQAYEAYVKGRFYWNKRNGEALEKGIEYFHRAVEIDPKYALAYAGLADSYNLLSLYGQANPNQTFPKAKAAALRALQIDEQLPEGHTSLAYTYLYFDYDWAHAEKEFRRALELNPNYATAHQWYGEYLQAMGRFDEAIYEMKRALQLDPLSRIVQVDLGWIYFRARLYDPAIQEFNKALELDSDFYPAHSGLGWAYSMKNDFQKASQHFEKAATLSLNARGRAGMAFLYALSGKQEDAIKIIADMGERISPYSAATVYAGLNQTDEAFRYLELAYQERSDSLVFLKVEPTLASLHSDPRFQDLLRRINLSR